MTNVVALCFPSSDAGFRVRVRAFLDRQPWDLDSPQGIALLQALLRESYPVATIVPHELETRSGVPPLHILDVYRDGLAESLTAALERTRRAVARSVDRALLPQPESADQILAAWRAAERTVRRTAEGSTERGLAIEDAAAQRDAYHRLFRDHQAGSRDSQRGATDELSLGSGLREAERPDGAAAG